MFTAPMTRRGLLTAALLLTALATCNAQTNYLPSDCKALVALLPPPPADDSIAGLADLETVLQVQADRTSNQVQRAKQMANQTVFSFARPVLGDWLNVRDCPRTAAVFEKIERDRKSIVDDQLKRRWNRTRPYLRSSAVNPVVARPTNTSYPSGHSSAAALWATILSAAFPEKTDLFQKQVHDVMWSRVLGGVHYPSDTLAGNLIGEAIGKKMLESPEMSKALSAIREELAPHLTEIQQREPLNAPNP